MYTTGGRNLCTEITSRRRLKTRPPSHTETPGSYHVWPKPTISIFGLPLPASTSTPQLPFKRPPMPSNRDHKALNRATLGGLAIYIYIYIHIPTSRDCKALNRATLGGLGTLRTFGAPMTPSSRGLADQALDSASSRVVRLQL